MRKLTRSSTKVSIIVADDRADLEDGSSHDLFSPGQLRNALVYGFIPKEVLDQVTMKIGEEIYDFPDQGISSEEFLDHIDYCLDFHASFYKED